MSDPVRLEREPDGLAVVTFDSPPVNLYDEALSDGLKAAVADLDPFLWRRTIAAVSAGVVGTAVARGPLVTHGRDADRRVDP